MEGAAVIPGEKCGFCWHTGEGKEEGDGADRRARTVSEGVGERSAGARRAGGGRLRCGLCGRGGRESGALDWAGACCWAHAEGKGRKRAGLGLPGRGGKERVGPGLGFGVFPFYFFFQFKQSYLNSNKI